MGYTITLYVGLGLLAIGLFLFQDRISLIKKGTVAEATIEHIEKRTGSEDDFYRPVLRFTNYRNEPVIYRPAFETSNEYYIGEKVKILYKKDQYDDTIILTYWHSFGVVLLFFAGALVCLFVAGGYYWSQYFFQSLKNQTN
jgi:hypothetical protein